MLRFCRFLSQASLLDGLDYKLFSILSPSETVWTGDAAFLTSVLSVWWLFSPTDLECWGGSLKGGGPVGSPCPRCVYSISITPTLTWLRLQAPPEPVTFPGLFPCLKGSGFCHPASPTRIPPGCRTKSLLLMRLVRLTWGSGCVGPSPSLIPSS